MKTVLHSSNHLKLHLNILLLYRWALGVLIYFMLRNELPFGSWRESELDIFAKVAGGQFLVPDGLSPAVSDLLSKVKKKQK